MTSEIVDITTLKTVINENLIESADGKALTLTGDVLRSQAVTQLFNDYLDGALDIATVTAIADATDSIAIAGISDHPLFADMTITARFNIVNNTAACLITATPLENWTLASSFPALDESFLALLEFADAALFLSSHDVSETIKTGLSFKGNLQLSGNLSMIAWLLGDVEQVELHGTIRLQDGLPLISLAKRLGGIELGFFELPFVLFGVGTAIAPASSADQPADVEAGMTFNSALAFEGTQIPIQTTLFLHSRIAQFTANLTNALNTGLGALSSLSNGVDFSGFLPSGFPIQEQITLHDLVLSVKLPEKQPTGQPGTSTRTGLSKPVLQSILLGVESTQAWTLVENAISIEKLRLKLKVDEVMTQKKVAIAILGDIGLG